MAINKRDLIKATGLGGLAFGFTRGYQTEAQAYPSLTDAAKGPFAANWESLGENYQAPDWFRDAKFGLWAHWGPQCVPEAGDWYAREMYMQGSDKYKHHLENYGHPADTGFIDLLPKWTADKFNPEDLLKLYKQAGAKYFVAMANHHDNFDAYDSKFHDWNSTRIGPKKDIIGMWAKAARNEGLRFGVSNHSAHAWHWFQTAYDYDPEGSRAGERYDAYRLNKYEGKGKWWDGMDPQAYYAGASIVMPDGITSVKEANDWHESHDRIWDEKAPVQNPAFVRQWYLRCKDLIDSYQPDLIYFDNFGLPLEQAGLDITAHFYNSSIQRKGKLEAVVNCKEIQVEAHRKAVVEDVERGLRAEIHDTPWQTDTCLGSWHYDKAIFENKRYKTAESIIHMLCDIVSKNGNLLLSVPVKPDGTIDSEERKIVTEIGEWMSLYADEAIYGTRPWRQFGEGPTEVKVGMFAESKQEAFTWKDIRYTTKGGDLFAITMGKPQDSTLTLTALAKGKKGRVKRVDLVGHNTPLVFRRDAQGLHIDLPANSGHAFGVALKITGSNLL